MIDKDKLNVGSEPVASEMESLNVDELDIEELERRLELSSGILDPEVWVCGTFVEAPSAPEQQ